MTFRPGIRAREALDSRKSQFRLVRKAGAGQGFAISGNNRIDFTEQSIGAGHLALDFCRKEEERRASRNMTGSRLGRPDYSIVPDDCGGFLALPNKKKANGRRTFSKRTQYPRFYPLAPSAKQHIRVTSLARASAENPWKSEDIGLADSGLLVQSLNQGLRVFLRKLADPPGRAVFT